MLCAARRSELTIGSGGAAKPHELNVYGQACPGRLTMGSEFRPYTLLLAVAALAAPAFGHPGHAGHGLTDGFAHPFSGADHVLAMIAVGLCAAQLGARAIWSVPLAFIACAVVGGGLALAGIDLPLVQSGILASVVVLGLVIALAARVPTLVAAVGVGLFAIFHGHAHAAGFAAGPASVTYLAGLATATAVLHGVGLILGAAMSRATQPLARYAGGAIIAAGVALAFAM